MTPAELDAERRPEKITEVERLRIKAEWRAACRTRRDARKNAARATELNKETHIEQSQRADYDTARRFVRAACCCTTNHVQVITDYQSQEHTS